MACELTDSTPDEVIVIGVVPESTGNVTRMGDAVRAVVPKAVAAVIEELERLGAPAAQRTEPLDPDIWWE